LGLVDRLDGLGLDALAGRIERGQNNVRPETQIMTRNVLDRMSRDASHGECAERD
jgi:hypothetical protein